MKYIEISGLKSVTLNTIYGTNSLMLKFHQSLL